MFSPGDGFVFGKKGGSFTNTYNLNNSIPESYNSYSLNYGWEYNVSNSGYVLKADVEITSTSGKVIYENQIQYNESSGFVKKDYSYQLVSGEQLSGLKLTFSTNANDKTSNWSGPNVRNIYAEMVYEKDLCSIDPLSSRECGGYSRALINRMCSINPQSSPDCVGYKLQIPEQYSPIATTQDLQNYTVAAPVLLTPTLQKTEYSSVPNQQPSGSGLRTNSTTKTNLRVDIQKKIEIDPQTQIMQEIQGGGPKIETYTNMNIIDAPFYRPRDIYKNVVIPDNVRTQRQLTQRSNISHGRMVDEQYRR